MAITTADIHAAADRIAEAGQQPTLAAVRSALGGGSFTTISESMKAWKAAQRTAAAPMREAAPAAVTERMGELAAEVWGVAIGMANDRLASERDGLEATRQELEQQQREAAELADQLGAELDAARVQIEISRSTQAVRGTGRAALQQRRKPPHGTGCTCRSAEAGRRPSRPAGAGAGSDQRSRDKAEKALTDAARLAGKLEALQSKPAKKRHEAGCLPSTWSNGRWEAPRGPGEALPGPLPANTCLSHRPACAA